MSETATESESYTCIACPIGCPLELVHEGETIREVSGQSCNRGAKYAKQEFVDPRRTFSTTIPIEGALYARLPVKLDRPLPKARVMEAAARIHQLSARAPVRLGQVLLDDLLGEGVKVVASRTMRRQ